MKRSQLRTNLTLTIFSFLISITGIEVILRIAENFKYQSSKVQYESYLEIYSDEKDQPYVFHHQTDIQVTLKMDIIPLHLILIKMVLGDLIKKIFQMKV